MTAEQLVLDLPFRTAMGRADFYVSRANAAAVAGIGDWRDWPFAKMVLVGEEGAGKTHLAHVWAAQTGAVIRSAADISEAELPRLTEAPALILEDLDRIAGDRAAETRAFHLHNALAPRGAPLLMTGRGSPAHWAFGLPDLASRVAQAGILRLDAPDDALLGAVMVKLAQDRQLALTPALVAYALPRVERSFAAIQSLIAALDARALSDRKPPSRAHLREILDPR